MPSTSNRVPFDISRSRLPCLSLCIACSLPWGGFLPCRPASYRTGMRESCRRPTGLIGAGSRYLISGRCQARGRSRIEAMAATSTHASSRPTATHPAVVLLTRNKPVHALRAAASATHSRRCGACTDEEVPTDSDGASSPRPRRGVPQARCPHAGEVPNGLTTVVSPRAPIPGQEFQSVGSRLRSLPC